MEKEVRPITIIATTPYLPFPKSVVLLDLITIVVTETSPYQARRYKTKTLW
jgi:hypothetical protein